MNCYFCESSLVFTFRHYPQSLRHIMPPRPQMFFISYQRLLRYCSHRYHNFQGFFAASISKQCPLGAATYVIIAIYQLFEMISRGGLVIDRMHLGFSERFSFKHLYLNNASDAAIYIIIAIYQLFKTIS